MSGRIFPVGGRNIGLNADREHRLHPLPHARCENAFDIGLAALQPGRVNLLVNVVQQLNRIPLERVDQIHLFDLADRILVTPRLVEDAGFLEQPLDLGHIVFILRIRRVDIGLGTDIRSLLPGPAVVDELLDFNHQRGIGLRTIRRLLRLGNLIRLRRQLNRIRITLFRRGNLRLFEQLLALLELAAFEFPQEKPVPLFPERSVIVSRICQFGDHGLKFLLAVFKIHFPGGFDPGILFREFLATQCFFPLAQFVVLLLGRGDHRRCLRLIRGECVAGNSGNRNRETNRDHSPRKQLSV